MSLIYKLVTIRKYLTNTEKGIKVFNVNHDTDTKSLDTLSIWKFTISDEMDECKVTLKVIFPEIKKLCLGLI